ncbi:hypothetical protein ECML606-1_000029 [Escherichia phage ECML-606-1]|jgi:hypothetical protein|nr:hypothetical protein ECML606-1_000029 [Escherichia phage ECML-606-1]
MITLILPQSCGNALQVFLQPPAGATAWQVLRLPRSGIKDDMSDPDALIVYEGDNIAFVDHHFLQNNVKYFYKAFYYVNGVWEPSNENYGTPMATYQDASTDTLQLLRDRLEAGLMVEVERKTLMNELGYIQVFTAPPQMENNLMLPCVTLSLESEEPSERFIGDTINVEYMDEADDMFTEQAGWLADVNISITGWSLNPDERLELRKAIRRVIIANLTVLADAGITLPKLSLSTEDAVSGEYDSPMYLVTGNFNCTAPIRVGLKSDATIVDVITEVNPNG